MLEATQAQWGRNTAAPPARPNNAGTAATISNSGNSSSGGGGGGARSQGSTSTPQQLAGARVTVRAPKLLSLTLALPDPTQEEIMYKKGERHKPGPEPAASRGE